MWVIRTFKVQRIISMALPKVFEMHKYNGYETQMKNWRLMWNLFFLRFGNGMDLILIGHMEEKKNCANTKMWKQTLKHKTYQLSLIAIENGVECLLK
jgi:hypothetical protein